MKLRAAIVLVITLLLAFPAFATPLDDAKAAGHVGEQADGYLGVVPGAPASAKELVDRINGERGSKYAEIASKNETSPAAVAAVAGKKLIGRTPSGQWYRDSSGQWKRK